MAKHPQQITTADTALDDDMKSRIIKYSITMTIRTLCFVAAYFAYATSHPVLMWIFVAGAVLLPYPAVIFANAGRERSRDDGSALIDHAPQDQLPPGRGETITDTGTTVDGETVVGETVDGGTGDESVGPATAGTAGPGTPTQPDGTGEGSRFTADILGEVVDDDDEGRAGTGTGDRR